MSDIKGLIYKCGLISAFSLMIAASYAAPPKKVTAACKALGSMITYNADGKMIATATSFYAGGAGMSYSEYSAFYNARSAEVVSSNGEKAKVARICGASDIYGIVKFSSDDSSHDFLPTPQKYPEAGAAVYILRAVSPKKSEAVEAKIAKKSNISGGSYYLLTGKYDDKNAGCPVVNEAGEWVATVQKNSSEETEIYAVGSDFSSRLDVGETDYANASLNSIPIPKALPDNEKHAYTYIFMLGQVKHDKEMLKTAINDFVAKYPKNADGLVEKAKFDASQFDFAAAEADIQQAVSVAEKKDSPHYALSRLVYNYALHNADKAGPAGWTLQKALDEASQAYSANPQGIYQLQMGDCYFGMKKYEDAVKQYSAVNATDIASPETFFYEAKAREKADSLDPKIIVALDSAISRLKKPYTSGAAPYLLERANQLNNAGKYREATLDYMEYEHVVGFKNLNDNFYYLREQAAVEGKMYKQALDDINSALAIRPNDYVYNAEKAALLLRLGMFDEAIESAERAKNIDPKSADAYRLLGIAYGETKKKAQCKENLEKAASLGDEHASELIKQYK